MQPWRSMAALLVAAVVAANAKPSEHDLNVLAMLHYQNAVETELGRLAKTQAESKAVKAFGALVAKDHTFLDRQVLKIAGKAAPRFTPQTEDERARKQEMEETVGRLKTLKGPE